MEEFTLSMDAILTEAVRRQASDTHITVGLPPMIRVHGELMPLNSNILTQSDTEYLCKSMLDKSRQQYLNERGEIDFSYVVKDYSRFRCNVFKQRGSYTLAARTITTEIPSCERLGLPELFKDLALKPRGLILVTGPTGSGKSTTLAAMVGHINQNRRCHVLTLEEPIEYLHRHGESMINQREVHEDTLSFANALRAALREDPDVIMVGEMRDLDTISTAITASETGHLVLSTLHRNDAVQTINRIVNMFEETNRNLVRRQLAETLRATIAQKLVYSEKDKKRYPACEVMVVTSTIKDYINKNNTDEIYELLRDNTVDNMISMNTSLALLTDRGCISEEEALHNSNDEAELEKIFRGVFQGSKAYYE